MTAVETEPPFANDPARFLATAVVVAVVASLVTVLFSKSVDFLAAIPQEHPFMVLLLPAAGIATLLLYRLLGADFKSSTTSVVSEIGDGNIVPPTLAPSVFLGACLTILCGGAVGKEAAALQIGSALSAAIGGEAGCGEHHRRALARCGAASALTALLGTPLASAVFVYEMTRRKVHDLTGLAAVVGSSFISYAIGISAGMDWIRIEMGDFMSLLDARWIAPIAAAAISSVAFVTGVRLIRRQAARHGGTDGKGALLVGGIICAVAALVFGVPAVSGTGIAQMSSLLSGDGTWATAGELGLRIAVPMALLGCGFKGGEIMPIMAIGGIAGGAVAVLLDLDVGMAAMIGMVSAFAAGTNCPVATALLAAEMFGFAAFVPGFAIAAAVHSLTSRISLFGNASKMRDCWRWDVRFPRRGQNGQ